MPCEYEGIPVLINKWPDYSKCCYRNNYISFRMLTRVQILSELRSASCLVVAQADQVRNFYIFSENAVFLKSFLCSSYFFILKSFNADIARARKKYGNKEKEDSGSLVELKSRTHLCRIKGYLENTVRNCNINQNDLIVNFSPLALITMRLYLLIKKY